jgi:hypothetical protein
MKSKTVYYFKKIQFHDMKKRLFIIISLFLYTANTNAENGYNNVLHEASNLAFGLQSSAYSNNRILDGSTELSRIGRALVHKGHRKFCSDPATQNGITALSWLAPVGEGVTLLSNIIRTGARIVLGTMAAKEGGKWVYGAFKSEAKWASQFSKRGWTAEQVTEAVTKGKSFEAVNMVNKANGATRYVHPTTGQSVVIDNVTKELLHVGGHGFKY